VIVHDLSVVRVPVPPSKAETPLVIDPNAVLPLAIAAQGFQSIPRRRRQVAELCGAVQLPKLASSDLLDCPKPSARLPLVKPFSVRAAERPDHGPILYCAAFNVKQ